MVRRWVYLLQGYIHRSIFSLTYLDARLLFVNTMETLQKLYRLQAYKADRAVVEEVEELVVEVVVDDGVGGMPDKTRSVSRWGDCCNATKVATIHTINAVIMPIKTRCLGSKALRLSPAL